MAFNGLNFKIKNYFEDKSSQIYLIWVFGLLNMRNFEKKIRTASPEGAEIKNRKKVRRKISS